MPPAPDPLLAALRANASASRAVERQLGRIDARLDRLEERLGVEDDAPSPAVRAAREELQVEALQVQRGALAWARRAPATAGRWAMADRVRLLLLVTVLAGAARQLADGADPLATLAGILSAWSTTSTGSAP